MPTDQIKSKDIPLLLALIKDPKATDVQIVDILKRFDPEGKRWNVSTIHRRIKKLEENGIVTGASAVLDFNTLGLQLHAFVVDISKDNWKNNIEVVERFCTIHPYTYFKNRIYGKTNGLYILFSLPINDKSVEKLLQCFSWLKNKNYIKCYSQITNLQTLVNYNGNISKWDPYHNAWEVNFASISKLLSESKNSLSDQGEPDSQKRMNLNELNTLDVIILRELTRDSRRSQTEMIRFINDSKVSEGLYNAELEHLPMSKQTFSRRLNFLLEGNIIKGYNLFYDRSKFGIFNQALFIGKYEESSLHVLKLIILADDLPFPSNITYNAQSNQFIFWINLPPIEIAKVTELLLQHFSSIKVFTFGRKPSRYYFWHRNFDGKLKEWKTSEKWLVSDPLSELMDYVSANGGNSNAD